MTIIHNRYLHHVTLATGDIRRSPRSEVGDDAIQVVADLIDQALDDRAPIIPVLDLPLWAVSTGRCGLLASVGERGEVVAVIGVAAEARCGKRLWSLLHMPGTVYTTDPAQVPPAPWCGVRLDGGSGNLDPYILMALGDFGRVLAWAWIER